MAALPTSVYRPLSVFERACEGKERHASEAAAAAAMEFYQRHGALRNGDGLHPYRCGFCGEWHLGH